MAVHRRDSESVVEAEVGIALRHCFVPNLATPVQINQLRSFPSKTNVSELFVKIKNYPASSCSKFSHYSSTIILLELLLEVRLASIETTTQSRRLLRTRANTSSPG